MQLDTGADITAIGTKIWAKLGYPELQPYTTTCTNVSGSVLPIHGFFYATFSYKQKEKVLPIAVLVRPHTALISAQAIDELGLVTYDHGIIDNQCRISTIKSLPFGNSFPELFSDIGKCTKATVHLRLKPEAQPVYITRRPIPLALEESLDAELDRLVHDGILTPVESSAWAAPIVVARKKNR